MRIEQIRVNAATAAVICPRLTADWAQKTLGAERVGRYDGGSRVVLAFAEPRAWKGRSGFSAASRDALATP